MYAQGQEIYSLDTEMDTVRDLSPIDSLAKTYTPGQSREQEMQSWPPHGSGGPAI